MSTSIMIIDKGEDEEGNLTIAFKRDSSDAEENADVLVPKGELVTWNNRTNVPLTLKALNPDGEYITGEIRPGTGSEPSFQADVSLEYHCVSPDYPHVKITIPDS